jgi:hypothetical protein
MDTVEDIVKKAEEWREKRRLYKQKNSEKINQQRKTGKQLEWRTTKLTCGCGSVISQQHKSTHLNSKKHIDWYLGNNK